MQLAEALLKIEHLEQFHPHDRALWLDFRKRVELWPDRQNHPGLEAAYRAVADMPEYLPDEADRWEELRHQAIVAVG